METRSSARRSQDRPTAPDSPDSRGIQILGLGGNVELGASATQGLRGTVVYLPGSSHARLIELFCDHVREPAVAAHRRPGRSPENDRGAIAILMALAVHPVSQEKSNAAFEAVAADLRLTWIKTKTLRNRAQFKAIVPAHVSEGEILAILGVSNMNQAKRMLGQTSWKTVKSADYPASDVRVKLLAAVARSLMVKYPGFDPLDLALRVLDRMLQLEDDETEANHTQDVIIDEVSSIADVAPTQSRVDAVQSWPRTRAGDGPWRLCATAGDATQRFSPHQALQAATLPALNPGYAAAGLSPLPLSVGTPAAQGAGLQVTLGNGSTGGGTSTNIDFDPFNFDIAPLSSSDNHQLNALLSPTLGTPAAGPSLAPTNVHSALASEPAGALPR